MEYKEIIFNVFGEKKNKKTGATTTAVAVTAAAIVFFVDFNHIIKTKQNKTKKNQQQTCKSKRKLSARAHDEDGLRSIEIDKNKIVNAHAYYVTASINTYILVQTMLKHIFTSTKRRKNITRAHKHKRKHT